jgi:transposase
MRPPSLRTHPSAGRRAVRRRPLPGRGRPQAGRLPAKRQRWHTRWRSGGLEALRSAGPTGHAPRLFDPRLADPTLALRQGARAHGFDTDHWTLARIATVIERVTGVGYHPGDVWKLLRRRLGWRLQRPARRAIERDEQAIARWVAQDWP